MNDYYLQVLLQCPKLQHLAMTGCSNLGSLMLWSDELQELDLTGAIAGYPTQWRSGFQCEPETGHKRSADLVTCHC